MNSGLHICLDSDNRFKYTRNLEGEVVLCQYKSTQKEHGDTRDLRFLVQSLVASENSKLFFLGRHTIET